MSERWPGGIVSATAPTVSVASASGIWTMDQANYYIANGTWPYPGYGFGLWAWGYGINGELGLGNTTNYSSPKQVGSLTSWSKAFTGQQQSSFAIKNDGTLWTWGGNNLGQLGLGNTTSYSSPKQVGALANWSQIAVTNGSSTLAIKTDGTLWSWGQGGNGMLGFGNVTNYSSPKQVGALTNWLKLTTGYAYTAHVLAVKQDNTLWAWGLNTYGNLGLGNTTSYSSPKQVGSLTNWLSIATSYYASYAIKTDGTLWSWGNNTYGNLGLGNATQYNSPKQVGALTNWLSISAGFYGPMALKTDGTMWGWGKNSGGCAGRLGSGSVTNYSSPIQIGALTTWSKLSASAYAGAAIKTDKTLWVWGQGSTYGMLGLGNMTNYSSPKQLGSLASWTDISVGQQYMFAIAS